MAFRKNPPVKNKNREVHEITITMLPTHDFPSDKDVLSLLKKAWKLGLCHCTDQASFEESSHCFSCCCPLLQGHPSITYHDCSSSFSHSYPASVWKKLDGRQNVQFFSLTYYVKKELINNTNWL